MFFKNLAWSVTRYNGNLSSSKISEKTNDEILRKFSSGWTDGWTDKQRVFLQDTVRLKSSIHRGKESESFHVAVIHKKSKNSFNGLAKFITKNS